jgi:hypothetical protein
MGQPAFPPRSSQAWIPWFVLGAAAVEIASTRFIPGWRQRLALPLLAGIGFAALLRHGWGGASRELPLAATFAVAAFYTHVWLALARRLGPLETLGTLAIAAGTVSATLGLAGSAILAQLAGAVAAVASAAALVGWWRGSGAGLPLIGATFALALLALGANGFIYAELKRPSALLLLFAPLAALILPRFIPRGIPFARTTVTWSLLLMLGGLAVFLAWKASPPLEF